MIKVGLTGGIGAGKTVVSKVFEIFGIPVYQSDERAKWLMNHDPELKASILERFGPSIYNHEGLLDRKKLANIVFKDKYALNDLNSLVHPRVFSDNQQWYKQYRDTPFAIKEAAILIESGAHRHVDKIIVVTCPKEIRIQRVMKRGGQSRKAVEQRMNNQMDPVKLAGFADFVIENEGRNSILAQCRSLWLKLTINTV